MISDEKELEKYKKILNDFEVFDKISDVFVSVAKCMEYTLTDNRGRDVTEEMNNLIGILINLNLERIIFN